jgi:hypothetical protein
MNSKVKIALSDSGMNPKILDFPTQELARKELQHSHYTCAVVHDIAGRVISIWRRERHQASWSYKDVGVQHR